MKMLCYTVALLLAICAATSRAQDPVKVSPGLYKVLLENDHVRVLDINLKAGDKSPMHEHPESVIYALNSGTVRFTDPDGKTTDVEFKPGQCVWRGAEKHEPQNIGKTDVHAIQIELKR
jgi:mannose-6-phosphate isomerase-like protein (cupin superfamily)